MKKIGKLLLVAVLALMCNIFCVNAETKYVGEKKYEFTKIDDEKPIMFLLGKGEKTYAAELNMFATSEEDSFKLYELELGEKISLKSDVTQSFIDEVSELYANAGVGESYVDYDRDEEKICRYTDEEKECVDTDLDDVDGDIYFRGLYNNSYYVQVSVFNEEEFRFEEKVYVLDKDLKTVKILTAKDYLDKEILEDEDVSVYFGLEFLDEETDPFVSLNIDKSTWVEEEDRYIHEYSLIKILTLDGKELFSINYGEDRYVSHLSPFYSDGEVKFMVVIGEDNEEGEVVKSTLYVYDKEGNKEKIYETDVPVYINTFDGFIIVNEMGEKYNYLLFDSWFNKIYESTSEISILRKIDFDAVVKGSSNIGNNKEIKNGDYLFLLTEYKEDYSGYDKYESYYLTISDSAKTTITGTVKDKDGKPLKNYTVELHSTPRTVKTDENGYFKFENVEEGDHTITIQDPDGKTLAVKEIKVITSTETKLDGDTLYFADNGKGFNIDLKLDGDKLEIAKFTDEAKKSGIGVPKTLDAIVLYLLAFGALGFLTSKVVRKIKKIHY